MAFAHPAVSAIRRLICAGFLLLIATQAHAGFLTVINNEVVPLEITVQHRNHCFQTNDPNAINGKTYQVPPKGRFRLSWWHAGDWRGCGGTAGEFQLKFSPKAKIGSVESEFIGFWFDRGLGFGPLTGVFPNSYPGRLTSNGHEHTFITAARLADPRIRSLKTSGYWDLLCDGSCTGSVAKTVSESSATSRSVTAEQSSAISASLTAGVQGAIFNASATVTAEARQSMARTMQQSFERGVSATTVIDFSQYTAEKMREWNINGIYQWVVDVSLSDGTKHSVRSPIFRCVVGTEPPNYHPADRRGVGSCSGGLVQQAQAKPPVQQATAKPTPQTASAIITPTSEDELCSNENEQCNFRGSAIVTYGANAQLNISRTLNGPVNCNTATFGRDPAPGQAKVCLIRSAAASPAPANQASALITPTSEDALCSMENEQCNFRGSAIVTYGANAQLNISRTLNGPVNCNTATFGRDPAPGQAKVCLIRSAAAAPTRVLTVPPRSPQPTTVRGFELFWDGKKVNGPDAERYTSAQAQQACSLNRRNGIKIECRFNGQTFYKE